MEEEKNHYADEQLEAMLHKLKKQDPNILCPSGKKVTKLCTNPECKIALRCSDGKCKTCGRETHQSCLSMPMEQITELINEKIEIFREMMAGIFQVEEEFINNIRKKRKEFMERFMMGTRKEEGLKNIQRIERIYTDKNFEALTGKQARQMCIQLQPDGGRKNNNKQKERLDRYSKQLGKQIVKITQIKQNLFLGEKLPLDSKVLELKGSIYKDQEYINKCLNNPKSIELIFRASEHGFKAEEFHKKCDNIEDTFVLLRTEFGKTLAGYTHYKWNQVPHNQFVTDAGRRAFLLQLDLHQKLVPISDNNLIQHHTGWGPIFGGGNDLCINNECNTNSSGTHIGHTYNHEGTNKYVYQKQASQIAMSGATDGNKFNIVEYEVFRVQWN